MEEDSITSSIDKNKSTATFALFDDVLQISRNDESGLEGFLKENYNNQIIILTQCNYMTATRPLLVFFHQFKQKYNELKVWTDLLNQIDAHFAQNSIQFAVADFEDLPLFYINWDDLDYFGFDADMPPYVYAVDFFDHQFQYEGNVAYDDLVEYAQQLIEDKLWRTQPLPEKTNKNDIPNLKTVVASNFEKCVFENEKDVLITFHSSYSFKYEYNLMGVPKELMNDVENLVFYNYNTHENYFPLEYKIRDFPTSWLIPRHAKGKRLLFEHNKTHLGYYRNYSNFIKFLAANVTTELKSYERNGYQKDFEAIKHKKLVNSLKENYDLEIQVLIRRNFHNMALPLLVFGHQFNDKFLELRNWVNLLCELRQRYSKINFAIADLDALSIFYTDWNELNFFDVESSFPPYVFAVDGDGHMFKYDGRITLEALKKYCEELVDNKLYKTESIPNEIENFEKINQLVASEFWQVILSHEKDILVTFYKNTSIWESSVNRVIKELKCDLDKLAFYKYNVETNYLPLDLKIDEFPTSMLIPSDCKLNKFYFVHSDHLVYDNFTHPYYEELIKFLAKHVSTELTNWNRKGQRRTVEDLTNTDNQ